MKASRALSRVSWLKMTHVSKTSPVPDIRISSDTGSSDDGNKRGSFNQLTRLTARYHFITVIRHKISDVTPPTNVPFLE
jgi:hypothetical protein